MGNDFMGRKTLYFEVNKTTIIAISIVAIIGGSLLTVNAVSGAWTLDVKITFVLRSHIILNF